MNPVNGAPGGFNPLALFGVGGADPISQASRSHEGGSGAAHHVEAAGPHAGPCAEPAHTETGEAASSEGYAAPPGTPPGFPGGQDPMAGLMGFLAKLADPLGLFPGINMADPIGLFGGGSLLNAASGAMGEGGGGALGGMLGGGSPEEKKVSGQLADQGQMFQMVGSLASDTGAISALANLIG